MNSFKSELEQKKDALFADYLLNESKRFSLKEWLKVKPEDRIHLKNKGGVFTVVERSKFKIKVTCKKWQNEKIRGDRKENFEYIDNENVKCFYGGILI